MFFVPIPYEIQTVVKNESTLTGKSVRQIVIEKLRGETVDKTFPPELTQNLSKLEEIKNLKRNWNGNNSKPVSKKLVNKTKSLIINLTRQPQIFPTANNSIQLEYDGENNSYLEFQVSKDKSLAFYKVDKIGKETSGKIISTSFALESLIEEFYE